MADLKDVQGIIWDLDGTLYRFTEVFKTACNHAAARAAIAMRPHYDYAYAYEQSVLSEQQHGFSLYWFHHETGLQFEEMHFVYHDALDEKVIEANEEMGAALRCLTLPSVILTNASRGWVTKIMTHLQMGDIFGDRDVICLEDAQFNPKGRSTGGFLMAIERLGLPAEKILVVEDLPRNLIKAKEAGLMTALVHHGQVPDERTAIDFLFQDTLECIGAVAGPAAP